jgi:hypothetical protein
VQWLINEFKDLKADVQKRIDTAIEKWVQGQIEDAERLSRLEGEIRAMKARMGKSKE